MNPRFLLTLLLCATFISGKAQDWKPYQQLNSAEMLHEVQKLGVTGSVLYIAAHPDDENTRVLAWLANEKKVRTAYLSLTRGDGGQNLIGPEQGEALGIIRTQELLAARRMDGAEQFFTRAYDFGFSKNPEETFRFWNRDSVLSDVVWVIRRFQPDVIITRFPTTGEGGHGHHTASAMLAEEAFDAAADPMRFPEQLQYVQPWKTRRLFWNTFNFGTTNTTREDQIKVDVGGYNALLGKSYGEIAAEARTMHKSQGFGTALQRGSSIEYFKQIKGDAVKNDLFEGIDLTWGRLKNGVQLVSAFQALSGNWNFYQPAQNSKAISDFQKILLARAGEKTVSDLDRKRLQMAADRVDKLYPQLNGVWNEAVANSGMAAQGSRVQVALQKLKRQEGNVLSTDTSLQMIPTGKTGNLYWLQEQKQGALFGATPYTIRGAGEAPYVSIQADAQTGSKSLPIVTKPIDPVKGEMYQPLQVLPEVTLDIPAHSLVFENYQPKTISVTIRCHADAISGRLEAEVPTGWTLQKNTGTLALRKGQDTTISMQLIPAKNAQGFVFRPQFLSGEKRFNQHAQLIHYPHIPNQTYLSEAAATVTAFPLEKGRVKTVGYIAGAGDEVPEALRNVGYTVTELDEKAVLNTDLSRFDAIVTGVRAYNTQDWLQAAYPRLMNYVKTGGNLLVQYNTNSRIGPVKAQIAPDTFTITRDRVTDENAVVTFLAPQHPAVNVPNKIAPPDFENWRQERSIYHASNWGNSFTPLLSMADAGEKPQTGSLIVAPYGKGNFVYTGLVFFRELPAGVPGAYRLFANLLALPQH